MLQGFFISILIAGFAGGVVRGLVGFIKHQFRFKNPQFNLPYFLTMMFISGVVGLLITIAVEESGISILGIDKISPGMALIIGYAGGDIVENIYKIILKKDSIFSVLTK